MNKNARLVSHQLEPYFAECFVRTLGRFSVQATREFKVEQSVWCVRMLNEQGAFQRIAAFSSDEQHDIFMLKSNNQTPMVYYVYLRRCLEIIYGDDYKPLVAMFRKIAMTKMVESKGLLWSAFNWDPHWLKKKQILNHFCSVYETFSIRERQKNPISAPPFTDRKSYKNKVLNPILAGLFERYSENKKLFRSSLFISGITGMNTINSINKVIYGSSTSDAVCHLKKFTYTSNISELYRIYIERFTRAGKTLAVQELTFPKKKTSRHSR